jgi:hypothetical protein
MALNAEEKKLLDELTARAAEPDADDFEIEIFAGDKGARIPFSKASKWLLDNLGVGDAPAPDPAADGGAGSGKGGDKGSKQEPPARQGYFGKRAATGGK